MSELEHIQDFLAQKRLALVGVSRKKSEFSRGLFRELVSRGYDMVPVNPDAEEIEGCACHGRVQDIDPPVDGVLVMTGAAAVPQVVADCAEAGIPRVWLHGNNGPSDASGEALALCEEHSISVVPGYCPYMFLPETGVLHRFHAWIMKVIGRYPG